MDMENVRALREARPLVLLLIRVDQFLKVPSPGTFTKRLLRPEFRITLFWPKNQQPTLTKRLKFGGCGHVFDVKCTVW